MISTAPNSPVNNIGQRQERLFYFMLTILMVVVIAIVVAIFLYTMPPAQDILVGTLKQFPPANTPYALTLADGQPVFIVNDGKSLTALSGIGTHIFHCRLLWRSGSPYGYRDVPKESFEDPCAGGGFALNGGYLGGPSPRHMDRLKLRVDVLNRIYVDPQIRLVDSKDEVYERCLAAQQWLYGEKTFRYDSKEFCVGYANS